MKYIAILLSTLCLLTGCNTNNNTNAPDITSMQQSQYQMDQDKLNKALQ